MVLHKDDEEGKKSPADVESEARAAMATVDIVERERGHCRRAFELNSSWKLRVA